ncbi:hypothetical protein EJ02DRAFT_459934 [Clathrospora elynae]|uniref:Nicotinamide N-methyltransferase n=1 Tax=Clathrospora elynae TaxID=706981 RepID=A0A6A5S8T1_9PLEO|nr:hypothetical protein EJ02DRAFT_459934 [Clathrospora elynae]
MVRFLAGVGLGGIVSALAGAKELCGYSKPPSHSATNAVFQITITDYPAAPILDTLKTNVAKNIPALLQPRVAVQGHAWGSTETSFESSHAHRYTRVLAADCLWMPWEHESLARSMLHFLADTPDARILCIAGFHTGRARLAPFFEDVVPQEGLEVEEIYEMDADGQRRPWAKERDGGTENIGERKKWLVVARIRRAV